MNPNQYYGSNFMPMQTPQSFYQPPMMSPRPPDPAPVAPQASPVPQFNQPMMSQQIPVSQYNQPQYQYGSSQNANFTPINPPTQNAVQYQTPPQNPAPSQINQALPQVQQNYQYSQPNQTSFYPNQNAQNQNFTTPKQFGTPVDPQSAYNPGQPPQNSYNPPPTNTGNFYNPPQPDPQQISYPAIPNTNYVSPARVEEPQSASPQPQQQYEEPTHEKVKTFKPTNVIGDYKCSDFPNLYTGPFRYSSPVQRKPFTLKNDSRPNSHPNSERRTQLGLSRNAKRWELRGGKYYGCFTSRTNGLQDICPKAKCKLCPTDRKR